MWKVEQLVINGSILNLYSKNKVLIAQLAKRCEAKALSYTYITHKDFNALKIIFYFFINLFFLHIFDVLNICLSSSSVYR